MNITPSEFKATKNISKKMPDCIKTDEHFSFILLRFREHIFNKYTVAT